MQALPFLAAAGSMVQGVAGFAAGNADAKRQKMQAAEDERATTAEIERMRDEQRAAIGVQLAAQVSNGIEGGSGTALDALRQSQINAALDVIEVRRQGAARAKALREGAKSSRLQGQLSLLSGVLGAGSSYIKTSSDWAQERKAGG
jgi:DNA-binding helix-hairpin-helix protein with protein kinase domain